METTALLNVLQPMREEGSLPMLPMPLFLETMHLYPTQQQLVEESMHAGAL